MSTCGPASDIATSTAAVDERRDEEPEHDGGDFISFSESAPLRPLSFNLPSTLALDAEDSERPSFLSLTPDPALEVPAASDSYSERPFVLADSSFLSFTDTPPASSTPDPLSETLSVVQEEEEEEEEDIGGETKEEEEMQEVAGGDRDEEIDLGDAILLESGRSENVVVEVENPESQADSEYLAPTSTSLGEQTSFYYDKELKRWVCKKPGH